MNIKEAWNIVRAAKIREDILLEALRDNPDGPVKMGITRTRTEIEYDVIVGDEGMGDHGKARVVWYQTVHFGSDDAHCAGGYAFVAAGREQDTIAFALLEILESRR